MRIQILILVVSVFTSCGEQGSNKTLNTGIWEIVEIGDINKIDVGTTININMEEQRISGNAGCNNFFGSFNITDNSIEFSQLGATRKLCSDMATENLFFANIEKVKYFKLQNETLHLQSENEVTLIKLKKIEVTKEES